MGAPALAPRRAPARAPVTRRPKRRATPKRQARRATAKRAPARASSRRAGAKASARRSHARIAPRPNPALAGAALIPHAAVRTAGAVRDLSDSSLIVRLTAGRGWIAVLCALLGGIVALNVISLSINATSGRVSQAIEEYERRNSALRAELAESLSAGRVQDAASTLGLAVPAPEEVAYLDGREDDLERLASALGGDNPLSMGSGTSTASTGSYDTSSAGSYAPTAAATPSYTPSPTPSAAAPVAPAPAAPAPAPSSSGGSSGGGSSGGVGL